MGAKVFSDPQSRLSGRSLFLGLSIVLVIGALVVEMATSTTGLSVSFALPLMVCALLACLLGFWAIPLLQALKTGQFIREEGPKAHFVKAGTPTMGGLFFVPVGVLAALVWSSFSPNVVAVSAFTLAYGAIGWLDDWQVIRKKSNKGISPRMKLTLQIVSAGLFCLWLFITQSETLTTIQFPFGWILPLGLLFWPLAWFVPVAQSNAVNLTDGLDGLAAGTGAIALLGLGALAIPTAPDMALFSCCMAGACLGFLAHNRNPARVFMGDTGSLALGGALAAVALVSQNLFGLLIISGIFLLETLSVMAQVTYYKLTKDDHGVGRRLFKMAPFHHHLELSGWSEIQVVALFYTAGIGLALLSLWLAKQ